jgi:hypothetical protein
LKGYNLSWIKYLMASECCLTCGHTKNSHISVEEQHLLLDGEKSSNYCKVKPCDCKQFKLPVWTVIRKVDQHHTTYIMYALVVATWQDLKQENWSR